MRGHHVPRAAADRPAVHLRGVLLIAAARWKLPARNLLTGTNRKPDVPSMLPTGAPKFRLCRGRVERGRGFSEHFGPDPRRWDSSAPARFGAGDVVGPYV